MTVPVIAFFNNKGGVGKTSLVYHLAWMYTDKGLRVVVADLDPQSNLTTAFLDEEQLTALFADTQHTRTIFAAIAPLQQGMNTNAIPEPCIIDDDGQLALLIGDLQLAMLEDHLAQMWQKCLDNDERAFWITTAFWRVLQNAAQAHQADVILVDIGPNLGAINRTILIATDYVVVPLAPDLFSLRGMENLGPTLQRWRKEWQERQQRNPLDNLSLPTGAMQPIGYVVLQHAVRLDRPMQAFGRWIARIPQAYRKHILVEAEDPTIDIHNDPYALALLKNYGALLPMAQEARKPIFHLKPADGAIGAHMSAVHNVYREFKHLALVIQARTGLPELES